MTLNEGELRSVYEARYDVYGNLEREACFAVDNALGAAEIKVHSVTSRVKEWSSLWDKAQRKDLDDPFEQMTDLVGLRVVVLFLSDLPRVRATLSTLFNITDVDDKLEAGDPSQFGYLSIHLRAQIRDEHRGPRYDDIKGVRFEIQLRTVVMDAWANVSHYLGYKGERSVPRELRRDFNALSGLFYVADTHFELFASQAISARQQAARQAIVASTTAEPVEINAETIAAFLNRRYSDREAFEVDGASEFVEEISATGYSTMPQLLMRLDAGDAMLGDYEGRVRERTRQPAFRLAAIGAARVSLSVADEVYRQIRHADGSDYEGLAVDLPRGGLAPPDERWWDVIHARDSYEDEERDEDDPDEYLYS